MRVSIATAISKVKGEAPTALNSRLVVSGPWLLRILSNIALQRLQREIGDSRRPRLHATRAAPRVATAEPVALQDLFPVTDSQSKGVSVQQGGFKTGRSASQLACSVFELLKTRTAMGLTTYVVSLDLSKAFDRPAIVEPRGLLDRLSTLGASPSTIACLIPVLTSREMRVKVMGHLSDVYYLDRGVPQGSSQSPASYVRFCDVVPTALSSLVDDSGMRVGGVTLGRYRCTVSTFADDTLLLAEDVASTQLLLDRFSDICGHDFMALNTSKTVAMIVNAQPNAVPVPLMLNGAEIEYVDSLPRPSSASMVI